MSGTITHGHGRNALSASRSVRFFLGGIVLLSVLTLAGCASAEEKRTEMRESLEEPALTVFELAEAAEAGDLTAVRTRMDSSSVGLVFARKTLARLDDDGEDPGPSTAPAGGHSGNFNPSAMERTFAERFIESFQSGVTDGTVVAEDTLFSAILEEGPGEVENIGDTEALVDVTVPASEQTEAQTVRLRMTRAGQRWMLTAIEGTDDLYALFF